MRKLPLGLAPLLLLFLTTALPSLPAIAQEEDGGSITGWERFVAPLLQDGDEVGVVYFPAEFTGDRPVEILPPEGFAVHQTLADDPGEEVVHTAGEPFIPPAGRWRVWLQGEWSMTPHSELGVYPPAYQWGRLIPRWMPVAPAGRVGVAEELLAGLESESEPVLWMLSAAADGRTELSRRRPVSALGEGLLMPADTAIAALWEPRRERYLALSRPFTVGAGTAMPAPLARPFADQAWLLAYVTVPGVSVPGRLTGLELHMLRQGKRVRPDFTFRTRWGVYAVWFGLRPGPAVLAGGSDDLYLAPANLELAGGEIAGFEGEFAERPSLEVTLTLPPLLREAPLSLVVRDLPDGEELLAVELSPAAGRHRFDRLVGGVLEVVLDTHVGPYRRQVELIPGEEGFLLLDPEVIEVHGTVRHGGDPQPATLEFQTVTGDPVEAMADDDGAYRAFAVHPLLWLTVTLEEAEADGEEGAEGEPEAARQEPWRDTFMPPIRRSRELDVDIPDAEVTVRMVDALTGEGIAGARLAVRSEYLRPVDPERDEDAGEERRQRAMGRTYETDGRGLARLPPPRPGRLRITASADGYRPMGEPLVVEVGDPPRDQELEIRMQPYGDRVEVRLALPDGSPAAGAEVLRVGTTSLAEILFSGRADGAGVVEVPAEPAGGLLLLRHPGAAFGIIDWSRWANEERASWSFAPAAGRPLTVRAMDPSGEEPAPGAGVTVWSGGYRLSGPMLHWLLEARPRTDRNGFWTARRLPAAPVRVLVWSRDAYEEAAAGTLDTLAATVTFPWPETVEVRAVR